MAMYEMIIIYWYKGARQRNARHSLLIMNDISSLIHEEGLKKTYEGRKLLPDDPDGCPVVGTVIRHLTPHHQARMDV